MSIHEENPKIAILAVGGTIDKRYAGGVGVTKLHIGEPYAPARLRALLGGRTRLYEVALMRKDSTHMTAHDREEIALVCRKLPEQAIIITHGTDTMRETAKVLHAANIGKVIILTGALQPAAMQDSDADFNLGAAYTAALFAPAGVYIAVGGVAPWERVVKDPRTGRFVPLQKEVVA